MPRKKTPKEFVFHMNGYSVDTMPMNKLAEYIADLATVLGEHEHVHFERIESGCLRAVARIDGVAEPNVRDRIRQAKRGEGPKDAMSAMGRMNKRLADDNASADLRDQRERNILRFPGASVLPKIGPIKQRGILDGTPYSVGGVDKTVPIWLEGFGERYKCKSSRDVAIEIAKHLFKNSIRVEGIGTWYRWPDGEWEMDSFMIYDFSVLESEDLGETIDRLREIGLPIDDSERNVVEEMAQVRNGDFN